MLRGALSTIGAPVRRAITSALQSMLSKYIKHVSLEGAGMLGGDLKLTNLELRLDVFRKMLAPLGFEITRGFVKEIKIAIPWLSIASTPIEIKIDTVEFVMEPASRARAEKMKSNDVEDKDEEDIKKQSSSSGGWIQSLLTNILANIRVKVDNVVVKYVHKDIVLSLDMESLHFFTADPNDNWKKCNVAPPRGPRKCIHKAFEIVNATLTLDRYADGRFARIPLRSEYMEMPILDRTSFSIRAHVALDPHQDDSDDEEEEEEEEEEKEKDDDTDNLFETQRVGKRTRNASPPNFVPSKNRDPKQTFTFFKTSSRSSGIQVAVMEAHIPHVALRLTQRQVSIARELIGVMTKAAIRKHVNRSRSRSVGAKSVSSNSTSRSRASTTSGDEKSSADGGTLSDRTYTTLSEDNDIDLDDFEDADDTFDADSINEEMRHRGETSWTGWAWNAVLGEDSDDSLEAELSNENSRHGNNNYDEDDNSGHEEWSKALIKLVITSTLRLGTLSFVLMRHVNDNDEENENEEKEEFMDVPVPKTVSPFGKVKVRTRSNQKKRVQRIVELRANRLHIHVRSVVSGITPFVDLFVDLESIHAIPLLHNQSTESAAFLSWGRGSSTEEAKKEFSEHVLPGQNLGLFHQNSLEMKRKKRVVTFADEKDDFRGSSEHALCGRVLIPLPVSDIAKDALARSGSSDSVSMLVDVAVGPLSMWWDTEMAAVVLEVFANFKVSTTTTNASPLQQSPPQSHYKIQRRRSFVKLVEEWSLPNWKYVVTLSSIMLRGARKSSSSNGVGILNIRHVEAEMGSGDYASKDKDASIQISVSEADFSVFCDEKETRMIHLNTLAISTTCTFLNLENVAFGDMQLHLKTCRLDLVPTSLLPFISTISSTVKALLLVSRAYKELIHHNDVDKLRDRRVAPLPAYVNVKDVEINLGGRAQICHRSLRQNRVGMYTEVRVGCVDLVANGNEIMARGGGGGGGEGSSEECCLKCRLDVKDIPCGLMFGIESYVRSLDTCGLIPGRRIVRKRTSNSSNITPKIRVEILTSALKMSWPVTIRFVNSLDYTFVRVREIIRSVRLIRNTTTATTSLVQKELTYEMMEENIFPKKKKKKTQYHSFQKYDIANTVVDVNVRLDIITIILSRDSLCAQLGPLSLRSENSTLSELRLNCELNDANLTCQHVSIVSLDDRVRISTKTILKVRNEICYDTNSDVSVDIPQIKVIASLEASRALVSVPRRVLEEDYYYDKGIEKQNLMEPVLHEKKIQSFLFPERNRVCTQLKWSGLSLKLCPPQSKDMQPHITAPAEILAALGESDMCLDLEIDERGTTWKFKAEMGRIQADERHDSAALRVPGELLCSHLESYVDCKHLKAFRRVHIDNRVLPLISCHEKTLGAVYGEKIEDETGVMIHLEPLDVYVRLSSLMSLVPLIRPFKSPHERSKSPSSDKISHSNEKKQTEKKMPICIARGNMRVFLPCEPIIGSSRRKNNQETLMISARFLLKSRDNEISKLLNNTTTKNNRFRDMISNGNNIIKNTIGDVVYDAKYARSVFASIAMNNDSSSSTSDNHVVKVLENSNCHVLALRLSIESGSLSNGKKWKARSYALVPSWIALSFGQRNQTNVSLTSIMTTPVVVAVSRRQLHCLNSFFLLSFTRRREFKRNIETVEKSRSNNNNNNNKLNKKKHLGIPEKSQNEMRLHVPGIALICSDREIASNQDVSLLLPSHVAVMSLRLGSISGSFETTRREVLGEARVGFAELWTKGSNVSIMKWNPKGHSSITIDDALSITIKSSNAMSVKGTPHFLVLDAKAVSRIITWFESALKVKPLWLPALLGPRGSSSKNVSRKDDMKKKKKSSKSNSSFKIEASFPSVLLMSRHSTRTTTLQFNDFFALIDISSQDVLYEASGRQAALAVLRHIVPIVSKRMIDVRSSAPYVVEWNPMSLPRYHTCIPYCPIRANGSILGTGVHRIVFPKLNLPVSAEHVTLLVDDVTQWIRYAARRDRCRLLYGRPLVHSRSALEDYLGLGNVRELESEAPVRSKTFSLGTDFQLLDNNGLNVVGKRVHEREMFTVLPEKQRRWHGFRWHHKHACRVRHVTFLMMSPITIDGVKISRLQCVLRRLDQMSGVFRRATTVFDLTFDKKEKFASESDLCSNVWQILWTPCEEDQKDMFKKNESLRNKINEYLAYNIELETSRDEACLPWLKFDIVVEEGTLSIQTHTSPSNNTQVLEGPDCDSPGVVSEEMIRLQCKPFQVGLGFYENIFRLFIGVFGNICVQDFSVLKWLRVISPMSLHFHLESRGGSKPLELNFCTTRDFPSTKRNEDITTLPLEFDVDKTSLLTIHYAVTKMLNNLWGPRPEPDRVLKWNSNRSRALRKLRYAVENHSGRVVWFGQHASPESVRLESGLTRAYSLWHTTATQNRGKYALLRFALETKGEDKPSSWSEAIDIDTNGLYRLKLRLENKYAVAMNVRVNRKGLSTTITLLGSHEIRNDTNLCLDLEWISTTTIVVRTPGRGRLPSKDDVTIAAPSRIETLSLKSGSRDWIPCVSLDSGVTFGSLRFKLFNSSSWSEETYVIPGLNRGMSASSSPSSSTPTTSSTSTPHSSSTTSSKKRESVSSLKSTSMTPSTPRRVSDLQEIETEKDSKLDVRYIACVLSKETFYFGLIARLIFEENEDDDDDNDELRKMPLWVADSDENKPWSSGVGKSEDYNKDESKGGEDGNHVTTSLRGRTREENKGWWRIIVCPLLRVYNNTNACVTVKLVNTTSGESVLIRAMDSLKNGDDDMIESKQSVSFSFDPRDVEDDTAGCFELRVFLVNNEKEHVLLSPALSLSFSKEQEDVTKHVNLQTQNGGLRIASEYRVVRTSNISIGVTSIRLRNSTVIRNSTPLKLQVRIGKVVTSLRQHETRPYLELPDSLSFSINGEKWTRSIDEGTVLLPTSASKKSGSMMYTLILRKRANGKLTMLSIHIGAVIHNDTDVPFCIATPGHVSRLACKGSVAPLGAWYENDEESKISSNETMYVFRIAVDKTFKSAESRRKRLWSSNIVLDTGTVSHHVRKRILIPMKTTNKNREIPLMVRYVAARSNIGVWHVVIHRDTQPPAMFRNKTELCLELVTLPRSTSSESLILPPRTCFDFDLKMLDNRGVEDADDENDDEEGSFQISMKDDERTFLRGIRFQLRVLSQSSNLVWSQPVYFCEGEKRVHIRDENNVLVAMMARVSNRAGTTVCTLERVSTSLQCCPRLGLGGLVVRACIPECSLSVFESSESNELLHLRVQALDLSICNLKHLETDRSLSAALNVDLSFGTLQLDNYVQRGSSSQRIPVTLRSDDGGYFKMKLMDITTPKDETGTNNTTVLRRSTYVESAELNINSALFVAVDDALIRTIISTITPIVESLSESLPNEKKKSENKTNKIFPNWIRSLNTPKMYIGSLKVSSLQLVVTFQATHPVYVSLDRTPLGFAPLSLKHVLASPARFAQDLAANYVADALIVAPALVGSLEILGNPTALFRSVGTGLYDLVAMPMNGAEEDGFRGLLKGIGSASISFSKHLTQGTLNSLAGFSTSVARNLDRLSFDRNHVKRREARRLLPSSSLSSSSSSSPSRDGNSTSSSSSSSTSSSSSSLLGGVWGGVTSLGASLLDASTGLVTNPLSGGMKTGITGVFGGVATGLAGVVTKPLGAAFDAVSQTSQSLLRVTGYDETRGEKRMRTSRSRHVEENLILRFRWKTLPESAEREPIIFAVAASELRVVNEEARVRDCLILVLTSQLFVLRGRRHVICHHICFSEIANVHRDDLSEGDEEDRVVFRFRLRSSDEVFSFRMSRSDAKTFDTFW